jgi:replicative DNA helicase
LVSPEVGDRVLPHNLEAERAVLGAVLVDSEAWPVASSLITPAEFYRDAHRRIFDAIARLALDGKPADLLILKEELERSSELDEVGGAPYLAALLDGVPRATNVAYYAGIVREKAKLRATIFAANGMLAAAYLSDQPAAEIIDSGVRTFLSMSSSASGSVSTIAEATAAYVARLDADRGDVIPTGLSDLDALIGGFERKHLTVVAARPSVGKTSLISCIADNVAGRGEPAGFITVEMPPEAIAGNLLSVHSGVSSSKFRRKEHISESEWGDISGAMRLVDGRPLYLVRDAQTLTHVASWTRRLREQYNVRWIGVDYLQLLGDPSAANRQLEVAAISRGLKKVAENEDVAMVALAMVGRDSEKRLDKRPTLSDLRESGAIEQDADMALLLYREEMHKNKDDNKGVAEIIVAKNRTGPVGTIRVAFVKETTRWATLARF